MKSTLVWVRILGLPMDFLSKHAIKAKGNEIGTTILVYDSFITSGKHSMARFFMDQDIMKDPYEYLELILGPRRYTQPPMNPFSVLGAMHMVTLWLIIPNHSSGRCGRKCIKQHPNLKERNK